MRGRGITSRFTRPDESMHVIPGRHRALLLALDLRGDRVDNKKAERETISMDVPFATQQITSTGTWNLPGPISSYAFATYRDPKGRLVNLPVQVSGEKITGQIEGPAPAQS